ncbi:MAG: ABC transporter ATP-binding protein [Bacteroidales bacterium]|jgi:ABC-type Fe3+/spermidine/putrescine transport system ATPase subunit|nr:ABC transporter ATP-binding protein [Bacteroidales bacterium]
MLELRDISKSYGSFKLMNINLQIREGEYFILLGRSGAGKSQLLEIIAGLQSPDSGSIFLNEKDITGEKIQNRKIGMVFQDFAIFPHLTVYENIAYPLRIKHLPRKEIRFMVGKMAENVNISHLLDRKTDDLSGGEKQRVAVARTLVTSPDIILLDEPMASIDATLRDDVRRLLRKINDLGMTIMHVTHDYGEAIRLAHRVGVIHNGKILQTGTPDKVFSEPVNKFVARFAGIRNFFPVRIEDGNGGKVAISDKLKFILPAGDYPEKGLLILKSDSIKLSPGKQNNCVNCIKGEVSELNRAENGYEVFVDAGDLFHVLVSNKLFEQLSLIPGQEVFLSFSPGELKLI